MQPVDADVAVRLAVERLATAPPRLGRTRLVCVDGPAGSGKTTLAGRLAGALPQPSTTSTSGTGTGVSSPSKRPACQS